MACSPFGPIQIEDYGHHDALLIHSLRMLSRRGVCLPTVRVTSILIVILRPGFEMLEVKSRGLVYQVIGHGSPSKLDTNNYLIVKFTKNLIRGKH